MLDKNQIESLHELFKKYQYVMTLSELKKENIYYDILNPMVKEGYLFKNNKDIYFWASEKKQKNEIYFIHRLFPNAIFCMETALYYYGYIDTLPDKWNIALDKHSSKVNLDINYPLIKAYRMESHLFSIGLTTIEIDGQKIPIYDRERTICDVLKNMHKMDKKMVTQALKSYVYNTRIKVVPLFDYARMLHVETKATDILGIWL